MKSRIEEACEDIKFVEFLKKLKNTANYYIALKRDLKDSADAIDLCVAAAWLEAKK